jgi:hypothetical protein
MNIGRLSMWGVPLLGALALVSFAGRQSQAASTLVVGGSGSYTTLQAAIDDAADFDTISVNPGTYAGFDLRNHADSSLEVTVTATGSKAATKITTAVIFAGDETSAFTISGFTFVGDGVGGNNDPNVVCYGAAPTIDDCDFVDCYYAWAGGAITLFEGLVTDCTFTRCVTADRGGAISGNEDAVVEDSDFIDCDSTHGGAIAGVGTVRGCTFTRCLATRDLDDEDASLDGRGGALYQIGTLIQDCTFTDCEALTYGGAIAYCDADITGCTISGCESGTATIDGDGGALYLCDGLIERNRIFDNLATGRGGAMAVCSGTVIQNNLMYENTGEEHGGALFNCDSYIQANTITQNDTDGRGGGLRNCDGGSAVKIRNNIIHGNTAGQGGANADNVSNSKNPNYCLLNGWTGGGTGNVNGAPAFVDATNSSLALWDLDLTSTSKAIDRGTDLATASLNPLDEDFDGDDRNVDVQGVGDGNGIDYDIGAYEYGN